MFYLLSKNGKAEKEKIKGVKKSQTIDIKTANWTNYGYIVYLEKKNHKYFFN